MFQENSVMRHIVEFGMKGTNSFILDVFAVLMLKSLRCHTYLPLQIF